MDEMLSGTGWVPSLVILGGIGIFFGMIYIAANSERFKQVVQEENEKARKRSSSAK